jgi:hypothetical protein
LILALTPLAAGQASDTSWSKRFAQPGLQGRVFGLVTWQGRLVAGGFGFKSDGRDLGHLAIHDGVARGALGAGPGGIVCDLVEFQGELIAAGEFSGSEPRVLSFEVHADELWVGGEFAQAGGLTARNVPVWNGARLAAAFPVRSAPVFMRWPPSRGSCT